MRNSADKIRKFIHDEQGLSTVEYAVAGTLVTLGLVLAFTNLGIPIANQIAAISALL